MAADAGEIAAAIFRGGFPELALNSEIDRQLWCSAYVQTCLERDVRNLRAVGDLCDFQRFLFGLAARTGSLVQYADLAREIGGTAKTVKARISVLEASGQVLILKPYFAKFG